MFYKRAKLDDVEFILLRPATAASTCAARRIFTSKDEQESSLLKSVFDIFFNIKSRLGDDFPSYIAGASVGTSVNE